MKFPIGIDFETGIFQKSSFFLIPLQNYNVKAEHQIFIIKNN